MDLVNDVGVTQKRIDELRESGVVLSPQQIENLKYEAIGRGLTQKTNVLHTENGAIVTTDYFDALLATSMSRFTTRDFFIILKYSLYTMSKTNIWGSFTMER